MVIVVVIGFWAFVFKARFVETEVALATAQKMYRQSESIKRFVSELAEVIYMPGERGETESKIKDVYNLKRLLPGAKKKGSNPVAAQPDQFRRVTI